MSARSVTLLIVALALAFVGVVLFRAGAMRPRPAPSVDVAVAPVDTLPAPPANLDWIGAPPARGRSTALVVWSLGDPRSLATLERAEQWRLLYSRFGLTVTGVLAPHAAFDGDSVAVAAELTRRDIHLPVALDVSLAWSHALSREGPRPRLVIADPLGRVRYRGDSDRVAEAALERLLVESHPELAPPGTVVDSTPSPNDAVDAAAPERDPAHATVWLGAGDRPAGPLADVTPGGPRMFHAELTTEIATRPWEPDPIGLWSLSGDGLTAARGGAQQWVALRYDAGPLAVVAGAAAGEPVRLWVLRDDEPLPREAAGADVRFDGRGGAYVEVSTPRLYDVAHADGRPHVVKLSPERSGLTLYAFVFDPVPPVPLARP